MSSVKIHIWPLTILTFLTLLPNLARAQVTNATCTSNEDNKWLFNVNAESPCQVWSKLQSLCLSQDRYINVPPLTDTAYAYNAPVAGGNLCQCNVVAYALMSGCTWCQLGDTGIHHSEQDWGAECDDYNNTSTSFAQSVLAIPPYALLPLSARQLAPSSAQVLTWTAEAARAAYMSLPGRGDPSIAAEAAATIVPTIASTTLSRSFPPITDAPSVTSTANATAKPTGKDKGGDKGTADDNNKGKGVPQWVPIVCGVGGGIVVLLLAVLLWRYWRRRAAFERGQEGGDDDGDGKGHNPSAWRKGDNDKAVWPSQTAARGGAQTQEEQEARRNNPYLQRNRDSISTISTDSDRSSRLDLSDSASEAEIVTRSGPSPPDGSNATELAAGTSKLGQGIASTSPRQSVDYASRPPTRQQAQGQWGSQYPLGSKAVAMPVAVNVMRHGDAGQGHASDTSSGSRKGRRRILRRNTGSTFLHPRKAPRPGQVRKVKNDEDYLSYTEDEDDSALDGEYSDEGATTDEVSVKSPVPAGAAPGAPGSRRNQGRVRSPRSKVAFASPAQSPRERYLAHQDFPAAGPVSPRTIVSQAKPFAPPAESRPSTGDNFASGGAPFTRSPLDYSSASSHAGSPRARPTGVGEGERSSKLIITNARPGEVPVYPSPDTVAPPMRLPVPDMEDARQERSRRMSGASPLRQEVTQDASRSRSPEKSKEDGAEQGKSAWGKIKDKTKNKVKEKTSRKDRDKDGESKKRDKGRKDRSGKIKKPKSKSKSKDPGSATAANALSPNPGGLTVLGAGSGSGNRDSLQTLVKYHSPETSGDVTSQRQAVQVGEASAAEHSGVDKPISPNSVYTHRTSYAPLGASGSGEAAAAFASDLHTREPLPEFVSNPLPSPPGSKRTSPLRPRKSVHSGIRGTGTGTPRASILGAAQVLGGRGSPSRMSASHRLRGTTTGLGDKKGQQQAAPTAQRQASLPLPIPISEGGFGRAQGFPGSIDFSLPPATPTKLPPVPISKDPSPTFQGQGQGQGQGIGYRGHSEYSELPEPDFNAGVGADRVPLPASLPSTKESHGKGDACLPVDKTALHFAIASTGMAFASPSPTAASPLPVAHNIDGKARAASKGKGMPRDSEVMAARYRSTQGRHGERASLAPTLPSLYEPKSAAPRWEAGDSMPSTPVKDKLDRTNRI